MDDKSIPIPPAGNTNTNMADDQNNSAPKKVSDEFDLSLIKTPFSQKGEISGEFVTKGKDLISRIDSGIYGVAKPEAAPQEKNDIAELEEPTDSLPPAPISNKTQSTAEDEEDAIDLDKNDPLFVLPKVKSVQPEETPVSDPLPKIEKQFIPVVKEADDIKAGVEFVRDTEAVRRELDDLRAETERLSIKKRSLQSELYSLRERKQEVERNRIDLEKREVEIEQREKEIETKIRETLTDEERKNLEQKRWGLEEERQRIENERWQYDQVVGQIESDIAGVDAEFASQGELLQKITSNQRKLELEMKKIDMARRKREIEEQVAQIEVLREKVTDKQKELRDEERKLHDSLDMNEARERALVLQIKTAEENEHRAEDSAKRHEFEKQRWQMEKDRRVAQDLVWKIQSDIKMVEQKRIDWSRRDEKFQEAIKKLKSEIISL